MVFQSSSLQQTAIANLLYTAEQVRELDRRAIEDLGIPGISLMKRAGESLFDCLRDRWPEPAGLTIFCGRGNNGGDGYILASLALERKIPVQLIEVAGTEVSGDARLAREYALHAGLSPVTAPDWLASPQVAAGSVVVDALLGTGFRGQLRAPYRALVEKINALDCPVVAADIPSGLEADTGHVGDLAVVADMTVTFIGLKVGLYTGLGRSVCGQIQYRDLGVPEQVHRDMGARVDKLSLETELANLPVRSAADHKGIHGHLLVVGGDSGFGGAPLLAAEAAARLGAGLVSVITRAENSAPMLARCPELMVKDASDLHLCSDLMNRVSVIVIGPGLGVGAWGQRLLRMVLESDRPLVLDADALNLLATGFGTTFLPLRNAVITPHPGEAARLLGCSTYEVNCNRIDTVHTLADTFGCAVVLKGSGTLMHADTGSGASGRPDIALCPYGNPGMGTGGMGDVLSGVIGSLVAQRMDLPGATRLGVCLHSRAADRLAETGGQRGFLASDLAGEIRALVNGVEGRSG